jgi:hypothetical protein
VYLVVSARLRPGREESVVRPPAVAVPAVSVGERPGEPGPADDAAAAAAHTGDRDHAEKAGENAGGAAEAAGTGGRHDGEDNATDTAADDGEKVPRGGNGPAAGEVPRP